MKLDRTTRIRKQNDLFRCFPQMAIPYGINGQVVVTQGIAALATNPEDAIHIRVKRFEDFTENNDPHAEHDFGAFDFKGDKVFWKIDYYADANCEWGSEDPADPLKTYRVLTIMLASEY